MLCFGLEGVNGVEIGDKEGREGVAGRGDQHGNKQDTGGVERGGGGVCG